jgi:hypothetical protein
MNMNMNSPALSATHSTPWWRVGMVWLVLGGPAVVVVAGIVTAVIAVRGAEPVLTSQESTKFSDRPAVQGRNHAATAQSAQ